MKLPAVLPVAPSAHWSSCLFALVLVGQVARAAEPGAKPETIDLSPFRACGLNSLFLIARWHGIDTSLKSLGDVLQPTANGESSIADIERASKSLGLDPISARVAINDLPSLPLPAIVHLKSHARQSDTSHYVVLIGLHRQGVITIDPPVGATLHPYAEFAAEWSGVVVTFPTDPNLRESFSARMRSAQPRAIWPIWAVVVASLGSLTWWSFARKTPEAPQHRPRTSSRGA